MSLIAPLTGWMLDIIVAHDERHPGFAGHYLRASDERRQVIAAFVSTTGSDHTPQRSVGEFLAGANHRGILAKAFGHIPRGFRRALGKSGSQPHDPGYYAELYEALAFGLSHVATAIMHIGQLNPERLEIIKTLPADLCDSRIINRIEDGHLEEPSDFGMMEA